MSRVLVIIVGNLLDSTGKARVNQPVGGGQSDIKTVSVQPPSSVVTSHHSYRVTKELARYQHPQDVSLEGDDHVSSGETGSSGLRGPGRGQVRLGQGGLQVDE